MTLPKHVITLAQQQEEAEKKDVQVADSLGEVVEMGKGGGGDGRGEGVDESAGRLFSRL